MDDGLDVEDGVTMMVVTLVEMTVAPTVLVDCGFMGHASSSSVPGGERLVPPPGVGPGPGGVGLGQSSVGQA